MGYLEFDDGTSMIMDDGMTSLDGSDGGTGARLQVPFADFRLVRGPIVPQANEFGRWEETAHENCKNQNSKTSVFLNSMFFFLLFHLPFILLFLESFETFDFKLNFGVLKTSEIRLMIVYIKNKAVVTSIQAGKIQYSGKHRCFLL